jgi:hypothetical protein
MRRIADRHPLPVGVTTSLVMHGVAGLIAIYVLVYEPVPIDLSKIKSMQAVPVILDKPNPPQPKPKPRQKPSLQKLEEQPPEPVEESPPLLENVEISPSPSYLALVKGMLEASKRYPHRAIENGHEGVVVLWFVIDR